MENFNLDNFILSINNYENFWEYDEVMEYEDTPNREEDKKKYVRKSNNEYAENYIKYFLDQVLYGIDLKDITIERMLEVVTDDYEHERARYEYVDWQIDIYYSDIYASASIFATYVNDYKDEMWELPNTFDKIIQMGQWQAYRSINDMIYSKLVDYVEEEYNNLEDEEED